VALRVDGVLRATADLSGDGFLRAPFAPVEVAAGQTVTVTTTAGSGGLALRRMEVDALWAEMLGLGTGYLYHLDGEPAKAATVYPLPAYWAPPPPPRPAPPGTGAGPGTPAGTSPAGDVLTARVRGGRAAVWLRTARAGRAGVSVRAGGRRVARCEGLRMRAGSRAGCHVTRTRGRLGQVVATAVVRRAASVRLRRQAAVSIRGVPAMSLVVARAAGRATGALSPRLRGRQTLTVRARARGVVRRCIADAGTPLGRPRCRLAGGAGRAPWILAQGALLRGGRVVDGLDVRQILIHRR
jgi:hypothetical protein